MWKEQFQVGTFNLNHSNGGEFSLCHWQKEKRVLPVWLTYRIVIFLYYFASLMCVVYSWATDEDKTKREKPLFLIYVSNWTHILQFFVFLLALTVTAIDYANQRPGSEPQEKVTVLKKIFWLLYTMALPCSVLVCIGFWAAVYKKDEVIKASTIILHVTNGAINVFDFFLVAFPHRLYHIYMPDSFAIVYVIFSAIYEETGGIGTSGQIPIYQLLDWKNHGYRTFCFVVVFLTGLSVIHVIFFLFYMMKLKLRKKAEGVVVFGLSAQTLNFENSPNGSSAMLGGII